MPPEDAFDQERKFVLSRDDAEGFLAALGGRVEPEILDRAMPVAHTRTTYLDSAELDLLRSGDAGPVAWRVRFREYAAAPDADEPPRLTGACFLEVKCTQGETRQKGRIPVPAGLLSRIPPRQRAEVLLERVRRGSQGQLLAVLRPAMRPRLTTWYRRRAFHDEAGAVRVTIDDELAFSPPVLLGAAGDPATPRRFTERFPAQILEIKHRGEPALWLRLAIARLPDPAPVSKFRLGMRALGYGG